MSGYLRRLVTRSLSTTPALRSALSLPFAAIPAFDESSAARAASQPDHTLEPGMNIGRHHFSNPENSSAELKVTKDSTELNSEPHVVSKPGRPSIPLVNEEESQGQELKAKISVRDAIPPGMGPSERITSPPNQAAVCDRLGSLFVKSPEKTRASLAVSTGRAGRNPATALLPEDHAPLVEDSLPRNKQNQSYLEKSENPEPLPPLVARPEINAYIPQQQGRRSPLEKHGSRKTALGQKVREEPTEVHVTIGRIEVTAVHAAPAAKRSSESAKKLMSLDEYLAHRQKGRA